MTNGSLPLVISRFTDPCMTNEDAPKALLLALLVISLPTFENVSNNMTNTARGSAFGAASLVMSGPEKREMTNGRAPLVI